MTSKNSILLVDDDSDALLSLARALKATSIDADIEVASSKKSAIDAVEKQQPLVIVLDLCLEQQEGVESGFDVLRRAHVLAPFCRVIILTGHGDIEYGIKALQLGAASFLEKPAKIDHLQALIIDGLTQALIKRRFLEFEQSQESGIDSVLIGNSTAIRELKRELAYAAKTKQPVLLTGETGTGKSLCARAIHDLGARSEYSFVRFQPNLQSSELVASELFGHKKGAFTGAETDRDGLLKAAHKGTLFLDEVDELPKESQVALLGALQEKCFRAVGDDKEQHSDFRLIAASNADIDGCVAEGKVRADFYHRLAHCRIRIPSLKERLDDVEVLAKFFLKRLQKQEELAVCELHPDTIKKLEQYDWPGNVRELGAAVENACYRAQYAARQTVQAEDVTLTLGKDVMSSGDFRTQVANFKRQLIEAALESHDQNQVKAAQHLGINRSTLRRTLLEN